MDRLVDRVVIRGLYYRNSWLYWAWDGRVDAVLLDIREFENLRLWFLSQLHPELSF